MALFLVRTQVTPPFILLLSIIPGLVPEPDSTAKSASHALTEGMIREWGVPANLLTDNGRCYSSEEYRVLCRLLRIRKLFTTPYHPSGNGQEERVHRFLNDAMAKLQLDFPGNWDRKLWIIELVYNSTVNPSTGFSPFFVLHGFEPVLPVDLQFGVVKDRISFKTWWKLWRSAPRHRL